MLCFLSVWLFCNYQFVLLNPFTVFTTLPNPHSSLATISPFSVSMSLFLFFCCCLFCSLDFTYRWNHMVFVLVWLISLIVVFNSVNSMGRVPGFEGLLAIGHQESYLTSLCLKFITCKIDAIIIITSWNLHEL